MNDGRRGIHAKTIRLMQLTEVSNFLLSHLGFRNVRLLVGRLTRVRGSALVSLLPRIDPRSLSRKSFRNKSLTVRGSTHRVRLRLRTGVSEYTVSNQAPPRDRTSVKGLVRAEPLNVNRSLRFRKLFGTEHLFPGRALPNDGVNSLRRNILRSTFRPSRYLSRINTVIIRVPRFTIIAQVHPPREVVLRRIRLFRFSTGAPTLIVDRDLTILLRRHVSAKSASVPELFRVLRNRFTILDRNFLAFRNMFNPSSLQIRRLALPDKSMTRGVKGRLVILITRAKSRVNRNSHLNLLKPPRINHKGRSVPRKRRSGASRFLKHVRSSKERSNKRF